MLKQQPSTNFCHWLKQPKKFQTTDTHPDVQFAFQQSMGNAGKACRLFLLQYVFTLDWTDHHLHKTQTKPLGTVLSTSVLFFFYPSSDSPQH